MSILIFMPNLTFFSPTINGDKPKNFSLKVLSDNKASGTTEAIIQPDIDEKSKSSIYNNFINHTEYSSAVLWILVLILHCLMILSFSEIAKTMFVFPQSIASNILIH